MNFLKKLFNLSTYQVVSGMKYKDDTIFCFYTEKNKYGMSVLTEAGTYEEKIPPIYDSVSYAKKGDLFFAFTYLKGKYTIGKNRCTVFDLSGQAVAEFENIDSLGYYEGVLMLTKNRKRGVLDNNFSLTIPCEYAELAPISTQYFAVKQYDLDENYRESNFGFHGIIDVNNEVILRLEITKTPFHHLLNHQVVIATDERYIGKAVEYHSFDLLTKMQQQLPFAKMLEGHINDYHCDGEPLYRTVTDIDYDGEYFISGLLLTDLDEHLIGNWGAATPDGKVLIPNEYDYLERLTAQHFKVARGIPQVREDEENQAIYLTNFKWGVIDLQNNLVLPIDYEWISYDRDRKLIITNQGGTVLWDQRRHKPRWEVENGVFTNLDLNR